MKPTNFAYLIFIFFFSCFFSIELHAQFRPGKRGLRCLQGSYDKMKLHEQVTAKTEKFSNSFLSAYQKERAYRDTIRQSKEHNRKIAGLAPMTASEQLDKALGKFCGLPEPVIERLEKYYQAIRGEITLPQIKEACVQAALRRSNDTKGWSCESEWSRAEPIGSAGEDGPCISHEVSEYLTWAVNKAIACLNDPSKPIDPLLIYKKLNNETGFSFFSASEGGVGIGQLTTTAIAQINRNTNLVDEVRLSKNPACAPFKKAMAYKPESSSKYCAWLDPSEGLARNLIYSIGYFLNSRDVLAKDLNSSLDVLGIVDARYYNMGALATYGKGGLNNQAAMIDAARQSPHNYQNFVEVARHSSLYIQQTESKYVEALTNSNMDVEKTDCLEMPEKWGKTD